MSSVSTCCLTPCSGNLFVYTYKEGVLSHAAHDLLLKATDFKIDLNIPDGDFTSASLNMELKSDSIDVLYAMKEGKPQPNLLKKKDKSEIKAFMEKDVLHVSKYRTITFESIMIQQKETYYMVKGKLSLHGTVRIITFKVKSDDGKRFKGTVILAQTNFGIKPFNALMGALKVRNRVKIGFDFEI
ncbi:conserved hypothetical protein [Desulfamplus magnetovallimortis]|uniref:Lipid/polyisoprenoid-binding YceI-like domain-containing protein n=1 Tax=Desulfamplus magnetovallimortis TaxID=1246637 RepID=A0A1W1HGB7_9BACT|nr:YceI family protein [Desulfamplus magnetovallimortis]SLM31486.1 conserved hypothetical protein [Desulfamplus magnetovallimortis]